MKQAVRRFKSLNVALKELEPFVRDGSHLQTGKPFKRFGDLRSRELLANWLLCVVLSNVHQTDYYFTTDQTGGDGIISDAKTGNNWPTEHVMVPDLKTSDELPIEDRVLEKITLKVRKGGASYAAGKTLLVFLNANGGIWKPNRVARQLPSPIHFDTVWAMGLQEVVGGRYIYAVTNLDITYGDSPVWRVILSADFASWTVERIQ